MKLFGSKKVKKEEDKFDIIGGRYGDRSKRTKQGVRHLITLLSLTALLLFSLFMYFNKKGDYNADLEMLTTPIGTELAFSKSGVPLIVNDVWTDKDHKSMVIKFEYSGSARELLSTRGKNYGLFMSTSSGNVEVEKAEYGILGTDGDGFLLLKGDFSNRAQQIYMTNLVSLTTVDGLDEIEVTQSNDSKSMTEAISRMNTEDINKETGVAKKEEGDETTVDYINFRVNPYAENTKVYNGSFLDTEGNFDYSKIISISSIDAILKAKDNEIKKGQENIKKLKVTLQEFENRLKVNPDDEVAKQGVEDIKKAIDEQNGLITVLQEERLRYENAQLTREDFGEMQTKFKKVDM